MADQSMNFANGAIICLELGIGRPATLSFDSADAMLAGAFLQS
jgi:hypothetical protein